MAEDLAGENRPTVRACESVPGTFVFLESGNSDGWIATDCAVEPRR